MNYKLFVCLCVNNSIEPTTRNLCRESFLKITMACFKNRKKTIEMKELPTLKEWPRQHNYVCLIEVIRKQRRSSSLMWTPAKGILKKSFIQYKSKVIQLRSQKRLCSFFPEVFWPWEGPRGLRQRHAKLQECTSRVILWQNWCKFSSYIFHLADPKFDSRPTDRESFFFRDSTLLKIINVWTNCHLQQKMDFEYFSRGRSTSLRLSDLRLK